jgi:NTP pyrophosphatase (non-canonical NTP hydrolase)
MAMEEAAELIQAINKCLRYKDDEGCRNNLIEEIADVEIMIEQLKIIFNITETEDHEAYKNKLNRLNVIYSIKSALEEYKLSKEEKTNGYEVEE